MRYLVEQVAHLAAERDFGRGINFQDAGDDGNINAAVCHHRLSVEMHHARFTTDDGDLLCFHCLDFAIAVYLTGKELNCKRRDVNWQEGRKNCDIHLAVLDVGVRRNVGIIAILRSIGACDEESLFADLLSIDYQLVLLGMITQIFLDGILEIGE